MTATRPSFAGREVGLVVAAQAVLLGVLLPFYGPHRDELYFVACGQHLAWGYPDQPSFTPLLARLATEVAPHHLSVLRVPPLLAGLAMTLIAVQFSRLLGAERRAQVLTAVVVAASALVTVLFHREHTATFDALAWALMLLLVTTALADQRPLLWLAAGVAAGVGLNDNYGVVALIFAILVGCALDPVTRPVLRTRWPWLGGAVAAAMWVPNLVWQGQHDWPVFALSADIADEYGGVGGRIGFLAQALVMFSPLVGVLVVIGVVQLLRREEWRAARLPAYALLVATALFLVTGGKGYYLAGGMLPLISAGCTWLADRRPGTRRIVVWGAVLAFSGAVAWPVLVPIVPERTYATSFLAVDYDQKETVGWPTYMAEVRGVVAGLPADQRRTAVVFTQNYGEAGAAQWYGVGVPVYSGHNGWRNWGPPAPSAGPVVVIGYDDPSEDFTGCRHVLDLHNAYGLDNEEQGHDVSVCAGPIGGWASAWDRLAHYDA